ncbi:MAG: DUF4854 domain-containing protein [Coriobacteriia bacterium]|nr:DUF4854 domain-containing protein [Coriobacteriia bacterium]
MKKVLIVALVLGLALVFAVGCGNDNQMQEFIDEQNEILESMRTDEVQAVASAEGTVLTYVYTINIPNLTDEMVDMIVEPATSDGQTLFNAAQGRVSEITKVVMKFVDGEGNELATREFTESP